MIWESQYWKDPLLKSAKWLRRVRLTESTTERTLVRIEKELFTGFYSIRKLMDTAKISDATKKKKIELQSFPCSAKVDYFNWHHIDKLYDLDSATSVLKDLYFVCNLFVHSYVFVVNGDGKMEGVYITTDRYKDKKLYFVSTDRIVKLFRLVGRDYPSTSRAIRDSQTGDWIIRTDNL